MSGRSDQTPRDRIVYAAIQSVRERGVADTSMRDVVGRARAPRGSLQHYFPGGKTQLMTEALQASGERAAQVITDAVESMARPTPGALFAAMCQYWKDQLDRYEFQRGCPLVAAAADAAGPDPGLRHVVAAEFTGWLGTIREALRQMGVPAARARSLAVLMVSALEGAILLARSSQDPTPLADVSRELRSLLDAAASTARR